VLRVDELGEPKVGHQHGRMVGRVAEQQVLRLEVAVHNFVFVHVDHRLEHLLHQLRGALLGVVLKRHDAIKQLAALDEVHDQVHLGLRLPAVAQTHDVRVVERLHDANLLEHQFHAIVAELRLADDLARHLLARLAVHRAKYGRVISTIRQK
jgi:hypothetical protein